MFVLEFLPAQHGDCILVRWGEPQQVMVVDGGPSTVYQQTLRPRLMELPHSPGGAPAIDVLCVSHVDDDHVAGVDRLLKEVVRTKRANEPLPIKIRRVWFNSVDELVDRVQPGLAAAVHPLINAAAHNSVVGASYGQGRDVRSSIEALSLKKNQPFGDSLTTGLRRDIGELQVTVVAPDKAALEELAERWRASAKAQTIDAVASAYIDRSVPNLSSIVLFLRYAGRTALLTGDVRGDHLLAGLEACGLLDNEGRMHVDVFKLPHHGSENNADPSLFEHIHADHYVVSADGIKHSHPSTATLEWLVSSRDPEALYTIHLTNPIEAAQTTLGELVRNHAFQIEVGDPRVHIMLD